MDPETFGFIALHRKHVDIALPNELPVCLILKKLGFGVLLLNEKDANLASDVQIDGRNFEIKRIANARNIHSAIVHQFRFAYRKSPNLILHIDQAANPESVRNGLYKASKRYAQIRLIWLVYTGKLFQLERSAILKGKFQLK
ncbi:MAG: hypothetical protein L6Q97_03615 [Thermoanaerobaculia bacterium]|nr:hypothetical protein [Thermoanaerobaculia bacterium]